MKKIAGFFDIDGTIARESLMIEHFKRLIKYEIIDERVWVTRALLTDTYACTSWYFLQISSCARCKSFFAAPIVPL